MRRARVPGSEENLCAQVQSQHIEKIKAAADRDATHLLEVLRAERTDRLDEQSRFCEHLVPVPPCKVCVDLGVRST